MGNHDPIPRGRMRRALPIAGLTTRAAGGAVVAALRERTGNADAMAGFHERTAARYTELLGHSKGVLMKAGQLLSMLDSSCIGSGSFSPYQKALARLQTDAPAMDAALANEVLRADLGRPVEEIFAEFADAPMAAASIGQVHHATLHDGRPVAVKIQYPGAAQAIRNDLANTELLATFIRLAAAGSGIGLPANPRDTAREIAARISEETDYRLEAANLTAFGELYRGHPFIRIPELISEASGDRVLTMTYLDGLDWTAAQQADQELKNTWAEVIWRFVGGSYRHANLLHGDPHPGNYRFGLDGQVGFLDFGCVTVVPERRRQPFVEVIRAAIDGRKHDMHASMIKTGFFAAGSTLTADETYQLMTQIGYELLAPQPVTFTPDALARAIRGMIDLRSADHPVRRMSVPDGLAFFSRQNLIMNPLFARLNATVHVRAITDDMDGVAKPITPLGKQHCDWVRQRGLPFGLDSHEPR